MADENDTLKQKLQDRKLVERAKWVLMKRHRWSEKEAFQRLQREAVNHRTTMIDVAQKVLNGVEIEVEQLTPAGRAQLQLFLRFRDRPVTVWGLFAANRGRYAGLLVCTCAGAALLYLAAGPTAAAFAGVATAAAVVRDLGQFRRAALGWPAARSVIDWQRVERLLADKGSRGGRTSDAYYSLADKDKLLADEGSRGGRTGPAEEW